MKIPEMLIIKVQEEDLDTFYLVLPSIPVQETEMELSEAELESVAGGDDPWTGAIHNHCAHNSAR